jgi:hypothetical protein
MVSRLLAMGNFNSKNTWSFFKTPLIGHLSKMDNGLRLRNGLSRRWIITNWACMVFSLAMPSALP